MQILLNSAYLKDAENSQVVSATLERQTNAMTQSLITRTGYWQIKCWTTPSTRCMHLTVNVSTIQHLREHYNATNSTSDRVRSGRPRVNATSG